MAAPEHSPAGSVSPDTAGRILAAKAILDSSRVPTPDVMYVTRAAWADLGGDPAMFDALPTLDLGDDDRTIPAVRDGGEVSDEPTPTPAQAPEPDAEAADPAPVLQDRRKPK